MNKLRIEKIFQSISLTVDFQDVALALPLLFQKRYDIAKVCVEGTLEFLLIKEKRQGAIESFIEQAKNISRKDGSPPILIFTEITKETQRLLLKARVPFLDYKGNLFIPHLGLILNKEIIATSTNTLTEKFSPSEQLIIISILLKLRRKISPKEIHELTGLSTPTIYRTIKKLVTKEWIYSKNGFLTWRKSPTIVYKEAFEYFNNPIKQTIYIDQTEFEKIYLTKTSEEGLKKAGLMALGELTMLAYDLPTYAISNESFNTMLKDKKIREDFILDKRIGKVAEIQLWNYTPLSLIQDAKNHQMVDPISLSLTLTEDDDPRVEIEVEELNRKIRKLLEESDAKQYEQKISESF